MGLPLACKDADSLCPLPATVAEQYQSCDDSGEHTIWKRLRTPRQTLFTHPLLDIA